MKLTVKQFKLLMWGLTAVVVAVSFSAWGQGLRWRFGSLDAYRLFPLLGLLAFGLMWTHYIVAALRKLTGLDKKLTKRWFELTSYAVLVFILLHPGLLILRLWSDGFGLPPGSYLEHYVSPGLKWAALLGSISLLVFLAYELYRWYGERPWWWFVQYGADIAMVMILIHGFRLGGDLQTGWFQFVWGLYAAGLFVSFGILYIGNKSERKGNT